MSWKSTVRSIGTAVRAAERDAKRRQNELEKREKQYERMQELEQASYEVEVYENHIDVIQSLHKECTSPINWEKIASSKEPRKPKKLNQNEYIAQSEEDNYKPGFIDRLFKREENTRKKLSENIKRAIEKDSLEYNLNISKWEEKVKDLKTSADMAKSLLNGDSKTKLEIIENLDTFSEISNLGSSLIISIKETGVVEASINVHGKDIVPNEIKSLLKSGKLSVKKMPQGKFNELYQDYVCSAVLRIANELFSTTLDDAVIVTAVDELLDTKTGHLKESPILSAYISRNTLKSLNLDTIDPSDSMENFVHHMSFKKTKGFDVVSRIDSAMMKD